MILSRFCCAASPKPAAWRRFFGGLRIDKGSWFCCFFFLQDAWQQIEQLTHIWGCDKMIAKQVTMPPSGQASPPTHRIGIYIFFAWQGARSSGDSESKWFLRSSLESLIRVARGKVILTCHTYIPSHVPKYGANSLAWEARCSPKDRAGCFCILFWAITCFLSSTLPHHGAQCHYFG